MVADRAAASLEHRTTYIVQRGSTFPDRTGCASLYAHGYRTIVVDDPLDVDEAHGDYRACCLIRFVRDAVGFGLNCHWTVASAGKIDAESLMHLSPPEVFPGAASILDRWRDFAFGAYYWRRGPGFILIRDVRPAFEACSYGLEGEAEVNTFLELQEPTLVSDICGKGGDIYNQYLEASMVVEIGSWVVALPYRVGRWPIPYSAI